MGKIDIRKLVDEIHRLEAMQREGSYWADNLTKLYSFRAHLRGKLHMTKREFNRWYVPKGAKVLEKRSHAVLIEWNYSLQADLIKDLWKEFSFVDEVVS